MSNKLKSAFLWLVDLFSGEVFIRWLLPFLLSVGAGIMGYVQGLNWFYIYLGTGFMFAVVTTGLLRFSEWRFRVTTKDKLSFHSLRVAKMLSDDGSVSAIKLGFTLQNTATFPIQFEIQDLDTELMSSLYPPKKAYEKKKILIPPNESGWFNDHVIELQNIEKKNKVIEGSIYTRLTYGRPENLNRELEFKKKVFIKFDDRGDVQVVEWYDI